MTAGAGFIRLEITVFITFYNMIFCSPVNGFYESIIFYIREGNLFLRLRLAIVSPEEGDHLFSGTNIMGGKMGCILTGGNPFVVGP